MKILFTLHQGNMYSGGQGVYTAEVTRELARLGHDVHLIVGPPWPDTDPAVTVHRVPSYSVYRLLTQRFSLWLRRGRPSANPTSREPCWQFSDVGLPWRAFMRGESPAVPATSSTTCSRSATAT
jgi:hypothetical protein